MALPKAHEETDPGFAHLGSGDLPTIEGEGTRVRLVAGSIWGETSPVPSFSEMVYADALLEAGARLAIPAEHEERAVYVVEGAVRVAGDRFESGRLLILHPGDPVVLEAAGPARFLVLGGEPMDGPRFIWWNFVSSSKDRIEAAKADWQARRFAIVPGDEVEFVPLPERWGRSARNPALAFPAKECCKSALLPTSVVTAFHFPAVASFDVLDYGR